MGNGVSPPLGVEEVAAPQILQQEKGLPVLRAGSLLVWGTWLPLGCHSWLLTWGPELSLALCLGGVVLSNPSVSPPCPPDPPGVKEVDYGLYPSKETQLQWLHSYLQAYKELTQGHPGDTQGHPGDIQVSQEELETLYVQVNKFSLVSAGAGRS